ncbi:MAG: ATP-binding protein, partial [Acidimicrobiia bacterium]|nr:ATP-binding protein [Acidimicrobiia bacterium]
FRHGGDQVRVDASVEDGVVSLTVADSGSPISTAIQSTMFDAYGRGHPSSTGPDSVGLGLTVSRTLTRLMGGDVVYHHVDGWSRFTVKLPMVASPGSDVHVTVDDTAVSAAESSPPGSA